MKFFLLNPLSGFRLISLCLLLSLPVFPSIGQSSSNAANAHWKVLPSSYIEIKGKSNVNTFGCSSKGPFKTTPLEFSQHKGGAILLKGAITLDVNALDCNNKMLNHDLRRTLKASEYPAFTIRFLSLDRMPQPESSVDFVSGKVEIELAGKKRIVELRYAFTKTSNGLKLEGSRDFCFHDFNLTPPQKVGGLIKVKDQFDVAFGLTLVPYP